MARFGDWFLIERLRRRSRVLGEMGRALRLFLPMTRDVLLRRYRPVPWAAFLWMLAALAYLVSPLDLIPDMLLVLGLVDDVVIVGWLLTRVDRRLAGYRAWRARREGGDPPSGEGRHDAKPPL
ncbi:YkvA family protein [Halomonas sp. M4R5S39]|uniref:YkvA family protein n=1 Tax=Halomonas kalidii TaxID=3043293 RepID=UPI0024A9C3CE|nr:YkvA family protein [Halomonas kalidii]MDI5984469.1 YkvA family protein [Halomonas kalidii]